MDFRAVLAAGATSGQLDTIGDEVGCAEIPMRIAAEQRRRNRVLLFERVIDADASVVGNLYGSSKRLCRALSSRSYADLFRRFEAAIEQPSALRRRASTWDGHERTSTPDLVRTLPAIRHSQDDVSPYLTSGILLAKHPETGRHHVCFVRMSIAGSNKLLINPATTRILQIVEATVGRGRELEVAILIGAPSEVTMMACVTVPDTVDKLEAAQSLAGESLAWSEDALPVPLSTEYVLMGRVIPRFEREGPVGDQKGLYSVKDRNPTCLVDEIRIRRNPVFHSILGGVSREHIELITLGPRSVLERLQQRTPGIVRYELPFFAGGRLAVLVVRPGFDPRSVVDTLWSISSVRGFVAVNEDVQGRSAAEVLWAIVERAKVRERFSFSEAGVPNVKPGKFLIDATAADLSDWNQRKIEVFHPDGQTVDSRQLLTCDRGVD
jgi:2,5-furandicarboxylate decarboxylase 1